MTKIVFSFATNSQEELRNSADRSAQSSSYKDNVICINFKASKPEEFVDSPELRILRELKHTFDEY